MENKLIHNTAVRLTGVLNQYVQREGLELTKIAYGIELLLISISKLVVVYTLAIITGVLMQTLIIQGAFSLLKRYSFGLHALNSTICTLISCALFVFIPLLLTGRGIGNGVVIVAFIPLIFLLYMYAPADTKARPLVGSRLRTNLKIRAIICAFMLFALTILMPDESIKLLLTLGAAYQCILILPFTYKILRRSERNYEKYEQAGKQEKWRTIVEKSDAIVAVR